MWTIINFMPRSDEMGGEEEDGEHQCPRILEISIRTLSVSVSADVDVVDVW